MTDNKNQKSIETMSNFVVTKSNKLIQANYKLSVVEQKIVLFLVSKIRKEDEDFKTYTLSVKEFCDLLGYKGTPKYSELRMITKKLLSKVLEIWEDDKLKQMGWISYVEYNQSEGSISLSFDPRLKPYLLQLKKEFTSYKLKNVMQLKSSYSIRLYEILKQWQTVKKTEIPLEKLRKLLGVENKYNEYHNFKKRVLKIAMKEINQNTDITFDFEEIKKGRKVVSLRFYIKTETVPNVPEEPPKEPIEEQTEEDRWFESLFIEIQNLLKDYNIKDEMTETTLRRWVSQAENHWGEGTTKFVKIRNLFKKSLENKEIDNPIGFVTYMIKNGKEDISRSSGNSNQKDILPSWWEKYKKERNARL
ncbi:replication initiation protein [Gracilibacillus thailandensis]|uniref:RepB family plasmid replication initiator protein n=2 Tax=Gracilibacillus thailandensis TaxID=563735 RepID=A0A6N7QVU9_9BACI|nr:replication initiation protein [Gracilibacillus thailandensis]MRI66138.1 RepB family plasmid replication initiator protein [Gracilibacillus thailandensis]